MERQELADLKKRFFPREQRIEDKVRPAIEGARKLIEARGWVRGSTCTNAGFCIVGAIITVEGNLDVQEMAFDAIRAECKTQFISRWNDEVAKTKKEVVGMLEKSAKRAAKMFGLRLPRMAGRDRGSIFSFVTGE